MPTIPESTAAVVPLVPSARGAESVDALIERVIAGDPAAWTRFVDRVHPMVVAAAARRRVFGGVDAEEARFDVAQRVIDKLHADDFARLRRYAETRRAYPDTDFERWLGVVTSNAFVDYLRGLPELQRKRVEREVVLTPVDRRPLDESSMPGHPTDMATAIDIKRIIEYVAADAFPRRQRRALSLWLVGCDATEIADELGLDDVAEARRLLQAARKRLRRVLRREGVR